MGRATIDVEQQRLRPPTERYLPEFGNASNVPEFSPFCRYNSILTRFGSTPAQKTRSHHPEREILALAIPLAEQIAASMPISPKAPPILSCYGEGVRGHASRRIAALPSPDRDRPSAIRRAYSFDPPGRQGPHRTPPGVTRRPAGPRAGPGNLNHGDFLSERSGGCRTHPPESCSANELAVLPSRSNRNRSRRKRR